MRNGLELKSAVAVLRGESTVLHKIIERSVTTHVVLALYGKTCTRRALSLLD